MLDKSHVLKGEKCHGGKLSKERITILLTVIRMELKKWLFQRLENLHSQDVSKTSKLPCDYKNQHRAWMTTKLFHVWLLDLDKKMISKNRKILLFIDMC